MDFPDPAFANSSAHKNQTNQFKNHSQFSFLLLLKKKGEKCALVTYIPNNYVFIVCIFNFELAYCLNTIQGILEVNHLRVLDDTQFVFYPQKLILKI